MRTSKKDEGMAICLLNRKGAADKETVHDDEADSCTMFMVMEA